MKMTELRAMDEGEAARRLRDLQEEMFNLRFQYATRQLTNHARIQLVRRDIARIKTLMREREVLGA
jgi:large subunit ribosomal protein L29